MYTLVYTCSADLGLYLAVVNCCQVLRCLRAQHPLGSTSWLIWGGSTVCHSLALTWWTCLHGLVRKIGPLLTEARKTPCHIQYITQCQIWNAWEASISKGLRGCFFTLFHRGKKGYYSCFRECTRCFSVFTFKLQGVTNWNHRQESKKNRGPFIRGRQFLKGFFFFYVSLATFRFHLTIELILKGCLSIPYC